MAMQGRVIKWNDERGFGFVQQNGQAAEIFVHISEFSPRGVRPNVGDIVTFDVKDTGAKGIKAVSVRFVGDKGFARSTYSKSSSSRSIEKKGGVFSWFVLLVAAGLISLVGYQKLTEQTQIFNISMTENSETKQLSQSSFTCEKKTHCSEMSSCEEATFYLKHCPGTIMDGDGDGLPCEDQWCRE